MEPESPMMRRLWSAEPTNNDLASGPKRSAVTPFLGRSEKVFTMSQSYTHKTRSEALSMPHS